MSTIVRLLWLIFQHSSPFLVLPCVVATISVFRWFLRTILLGQGFGYSRPCVCGFRASVESRKTLSAPLAARATPWVGRRPFGWRSSQFSRIPDRLCGRRLDD
ncbi:hypothetical protein BJV74DRAFT_836825 [Russula compacta]|nr:hypothetical protein BJV74DRAFT_836825 [Russula compacta]